MRVSPPHCTKCWQFHWGACAINTAINTPKERLTGAINKAPAINTVRLESTAGVGEEATGSEGKASVSRTPNRRSREAYNEYMRGYMKKRRSK